MVAEGHAMSRATLTFVGTATTLLRLGAFTVLTDPNFLHRGQRAYIGHGLWTRRRTEPALGPEQLPALDAVFVSHLHGDHFDRIARRRLDPTVPLVTTGQAAGHLRRRFDTTVPLDPWQHTQFHRDGQRLRITAVPGIHGPGPVDRLLMPPVIGSVLELDQPSAPPLRVYVTGDTLFRPHLARGVADRFPDLDAIVVHLGGTRLMGMLLTMDAGQGADLVDALRPPVTVPVHYDDYPVFRSPLADFLTTVRHRALPTDVRVVRRGETVALHPDAAVTPESTTPAGTNAEARTGP
jgi:L-ascorbate metabolism protein UlaG (beta-lactamase superfamily)